jgi:hypothetical protein
MGMEIGGRVQGVTPARRNFYERNLFYVGCSSTANASTDGVVYSTGTNWVTPMKLLMSAASTYNTIKNYSTRLDWLHVYFTGTAASSNFNAVYCLIDSTSETHTMTVSTANIVKDKAYNWILPLPPRTEVHFTVTTAASTGYFMLQTAEAFGDMPYGNP